MGNWIYNRAPFPLVSSSASILSQLFVLVWWSSIDSSLFFVFLCFAFFPFGDLLQRTF